MNPTPSGRHYPLRRWMPTGGLLPLLAALGADAPPGPPPVRPDAPKAPIEYGLTLGDTRNDLIKFKKHPRYLVEQDKLAGKLLNIITNQASAASALKLDGLHVPPTHQRPVEIKAVRQRLNDAKQRLKNTPNLSKTLKEDTKRLDAKLLQLDAKLLQLNNITNALVRLLSHDASKSLKEDAKRMALLEGAKVAEEAGQYVKAMNLLHSLAHHNVQDPIIPEVLLRQGLIYRRMGQVDNAISTFYAVMNAATKVRGLLRKSGPVGESDNLLRFRRLVLVARAELADTHYEKSRSLGVEEEARQEALEEALRMYKQFLNKPDEEMNLAQVRKRIITCLEDNEKIIRDKLKQINDFHWRLDLQNRLIENAGLEIGKLKEKLKEKGVFSSVIRVRKRQIKEWEADRKRYRVNLSRLTTQKEELDTRKAKMTADLARVRREFINQITDYLQHHPNLDDQGEYRYLLARTFTNLGEVAKATNEYNLLLRDLDYIGLSPDQKERWNEWQIKAALDIAGRDFRAERYAQAASIYTWLAGRVTSLRDRFGVNQQIGFCHARLGNLTGARNSWKAIDNIWKNYNRKLKNLDKNIKDLKLAAQRNERRITYLGTLAEEEADWKEKLKNQYKDSEENIFTFEEYQKRKQAADWQVKNTAIVQGIEPMSPAAKAGLQVGDQILWLVGPKHKLPVLNYVDLVNSIQVGKPGDSVTLTILRQSSEQKVNLKLGDRIKHLETKLTGWNALKTKELVIIHEMAKTRLGILTIGDQLALPKPMPASSGAKP